MFKLFHSRKFKWPITFIIALLVLALSSITALAGSVPWYNPNIGMPQAGSGTGGGGAYGECAPRGFSVFFDEASGDYAANSHYWLSSTYSNASVWPVYVGEKGRNGVDYIDPSANVKFYLWVDKNPTNNGNPENNKEFIEFYQDGVSYKEIDGLTLNIGSPNRSGTIDPSGQAGLWCIPITVSGLEEGHDYAFTLLRGLKTNNNLCLVIAEDGNGYLSFYGTTPSDPAELAWYNKHKYDEYEYRRPNYDFDIENPVTTGTVTASVPTYDEGSFYDFRFGFSTKELQESYAVSFDVLPSNAAVVVKNGAGATVVAEANGSYLLPAGEYEYAATAAGYRTVNGSFTVSGDATVMVTLDPDLTYGSQGFNQTTRLMTPNTNLAHPAVTALRLAAASTMEGLEYYLNRVDEVYDITNGKDVLLQTSFGAGMNNWSVGAWKVNGMRYLSVLDAETGKVVANWRDETPDAEGKNSSGSYQIGYALPAGFTAANQAGILYTIPNAALEYGKTYYAVLGSATCGNNNSRMLYVPVIFQITMSDENGGGEVDKRAKALEYNDIAVNVIKSADDSVSKVEFNRNTGGQSYAVGAPISSAIVGQEIALKETVGEGLSVSWQIEDEYGAGVPVNYFLGGGGSAGGYADTRFTMPNAAVTVNAVFGYEVKFVYEDGSIVSGDDIIITDGQREYSGEPKVTTQAFTDPDSNNTLYKLVYGDYFYVLPAGEYTYTLKGGEPASFTVTGNMTKGIEQEKVASLEVIPGTIVQDHLSYIHVSYTADLANADFALLNEQGEVINGTVEAKKSKAVITLTAPTAPGRYDVVALISGKVVAKGSIEVVAYNPNIWETYTTPDGEGNVVINFNEPISSKNDITKIVTAPGKVIISRLGEDGKSLVTDVKYAEAAGINFTIQGVKYPRLYPSFSFTFTATVDGE